MLAPPPGDMPPMREYFAARAREMARRASRDYSLLALLATNVVVLAIALHLGMSLRSLMLIYWMQSVIIGAANVVRMLTLHRFSTDGVKVGGQPVAETPATQRHIAWFFALHYGLFHLAYLIFIAVASRGSLGTPAAYALCALTFAVNHAFSLRHNHERDAAGRPNIGTLMFLPYARVVPMHLMIMSGLLFVPGAGPAGLVFFGVLKTIADAFMHIVEHHVLAQEEPRP